MAVVIKSLQRRRRTAQRGKSMTQSQRWGKVVTIMGPIPGGIISTSTGPVDPEVEVEEEAVEVVEEEVEEELPEAEADDL